MRFFAALLLLCAIPVVAQPNETYWFPTNDPYISWPGINLHRAHDGIVCVGVYDSSYRRDGRDYSYGRFFMGVPAPQGHLRYYTLMERPLQMRTDEYHGQFTYYAYTTCEASKGAMLAATAQWETLNNSFGRELVKAGPCDLYLLDGERFRVIGNWSSVKKPYLFASSSGEAWIAMERVMRIPQPSDTMDMRYKAQVSIARSTSNHAVVDGRGIGEGYDPRLIERYDGAIFVVRRYSEHSASRTGVQLLLRRIDDAASVDRVIDEGLSYSYTSGENFALLAGDDNSIHILRYDRESMTYYCCDPDLNIHYGGATGPPSREVGVRFVKRADGTPVLFWKRGSKEDMVWSAVSRNALFEEIHDIPGTASVRKPVTAVSGPDGKLKLLFLRPEEGLFIIRDATNPASTAFPLFAPSVDIAGIGDWLLHDDGTVWVSHVTDRHPHPPMRGITRVTAVSLGSETPVAAPGGPASLSNHPNPFTANTSIVLELPQATTASVLLLDALGREVMQVCSRIRFEAGRHTFDFNPGRLPPGVYYASFISDTGIRIRRMLLLP
jgi:hypothetical protein